MTTDPIIVTRFFFTFDVMGKPQPAGSKKAVPPRGGRKFAQIVDANPKAKAWQAVVAGTARGEMLRLRMDKPFDGPVYVEMVFRRERPQAHLRADGGLTLEGRRHEWPDTRPDVLKLARAVEDALTGIVYTDDALIVSEKLRKEWGPEGVTVTVMPL